MEILDFSSMQDLTAEDGVEAPRQKWGRVVGYKRQTYEDYSGEQVVGNYLLFNPLHDLNEEWNVRIKHNLDPRSTWIKHVKSLQALGYTYLRPEEAAKEGLVSVWGKYFRLDEILERTFKTKDGDVANWYVPTFVAIYDTAEEAMAASGISSNPADSILDSAMETYALVQGDMVAWTKLFTTDHPDLVPAQVTEYWEAVSG